ncbi:MAG TPA: zf-TFIIB domain-containing protein [Usitatibacter sp.]|nr:zf-TFIIB domain-containing protein [Usitatibacter sp.]
MNDTAGAPGARSCPGCSAPMRRESFARKTTGALDLDLCFDCRAIWFDAWESSQLAPAAILQLFREIETQPAGAPKPLASLLHCVTCRSPLAFTHDVERTNAFVYYRCPQGHGRFTTFLQFLREKEFVRTLTPLEVQKLSATVTQIRCSSCGAPVDITREAECPYCHAPIAILDADAVKHAVDALSAQEKRGQPQGVDAGAVLDALLAGKHTTPDSGREPVDLVHGAISMLLGTF